MDFRWRLYDRCGGGWYGLDVGMHSWMACWNLFSLQWVSKWSGIICAASLGSEVEKMVGKAVSWLHRVGLAKSCALPQPFLALDNVQLRRRYIQRIHIRGQPRIRLFGAVRSAHILSANLISPAAICHRKHT